MTSQVKARLAGRRSQKAGAPMPGSGCSPGVLKPAPTGWSMNNSAVLRFQAPARSTTNAAVQAVNASAAVRWMRFKCVHKHRRWEWRAQGLDLLETHPCGRRRDAMSSLPGVVRACNAAADSVIMPGHAVCQARVGAASMLAWVRLQAQIVINKLGAQLVESTKQGGTPRTALAQGMRVGDACRFVVPGGGGAAGCGASGLPRPVV